MLVSDRQADEIGTHERCGVERGREVKLSRNRQDPDHELLGTIIQFSGA